MMDKILMTLGGVALGVAGYALGEIVQERRAEKGEDYGILDLFEEWTDELCGEGERAVERVEEQWRS